MKKKEEKEYFNKEWKEMKAAVKAYLETGSQDDLHTFRVQVKKLRAFLILMDSAGGKRQLEKDFNPVRKVFKKAGEIRNAHINLKLAKEYGINNDDFVLGQDRLMEEAANEFRLKGEKYIEKVKAAHKLIEDEIKPMSDLHINQYYTNQLRGIGNTLSRLQFDDSLHQCRSGIKVLIYNYQLTAPVLETAFNEDYLQDIQTAIGDWHDNILAKELFTRFALNDKAVLAKINKRHLKLERNIKKLVNDFYNQATIVTELPVEQLS
jgi:CHAD domain-containing protein